MPPSGRRRYQDRRKWRPEPHSTDIFNVSSDLFSFWNEIRAGGFHIVCRTT